MCLAIIPREKNIYDTAARCPKFRTVKKKIYYGLNFENNFFCLFGTLIKQKTCAKNFNMFKNKEV